MVDPNTDRTTQSRQLADDVEAFLKSGGKIYKAEHGETNASQRVSKAGVIDAWVSDRSDPLW